MQLCPTARNERPVRDQNYGSKSGVAECFREYSLEDQVEALKRMVVHNEKRVAETKPKFFVEKTHENVGVRECLSPEKKTPFGTVIWELRNTVMNSYWNKEVGKTRYQVPNLPVGLDLVNTTFGKKRKPEITVAELMKPNAILDEGLDRETVEKIDRVSQHDYNPSGRINRRYNAAFDENNRFGKKGSGKTDGSRLKSRMNWPIDEPTRKKPTLDINTSHGKPSPKEDYGAAKAISDYFANEKELSLQGYLRHLNTLRLRLKKRWPEIPFIDVYQDLIDLDKDFQGLLPEESTYNVLAKYRISVDKELFTPLLDLLNLREQGKVRHKELVDLLNWKCLPPTLPKLTSMPLEHQHYRTAYGDEIGVSNPKSNVPAAGLPSSRWHSARSLISPSVFTRYNLSHVDFYKTRSKEEIRSIFEKVADLTEEDFERLWREAVKRDGCEEVSVETFRGLLAQKKS